MGIAESKVDVMGWHVLKIHKNSPAENVGLHAYWDFIVAINGKRLDTADQTLVDTLSMNQGKAVTLTVYDARFESARDCTIVPNDDWGGKSMLGVTIRFSSVEVAHEHQWHVLEVAEGSPAEAAGLKPFQDYIVGTPDIIMESEMDFHYHVQSNAGNMIRLYVYNTTDEDLREVELTPSNTWGGQGLLGCQVGYGFLHRIPFKRHEEGSSAGAVSSRPSATSAGQSSAGAEASAATSTVNAENQGASTHGATEAATGEPEASNEAETSSTTAVGPAEDQPLMPAPSGAQDAQEERGQTDGQIGAQDAGELD